MRIMVASVAYLKAAGSGYGIGLTAEGDRVEFIGDWRSLQDLRESIESDGPQPAGVDEWQVLAINGELRLPLSSAAMAERAAYLRSALRRENSAH
jgi:hypothetical protein